MKPVVPAEETLGISSEAAEPLRAQPGQSVPRAGDRRVPTCCGRTSGQLCRRGGARRVDQVAGGRGRPAAFARAPCCAWPARAIAIDQRGRTGAPSLIATRSSEANGRAGRTAGCEHASVDRARVGNGVAFFLTLRAGYFRHPDHPKQLPAREMMQKKAHSPGQQHQLRLELALGGRARATTTTQTAGRGLGLGDCCRAGACRRRLGKAVVTTE